MMALDNCFLSHHQPSFDWDPHSLGGEDLHELLPLDMESPVSSEASTGYLHDAVVGWSDRCKRRRLASSPYDPSTVTEDLHDLLQGFWNSNCLGDPLENLSHMVLDTPSIIPDDPWSSFMPLKWDSKQEQTTPQLQQEYLSSPSYSQERDTHETRNSKDSLPSTLKLLPLKEGESEQNVRMKMKKKKKKAMGVVYPFAVVKPGGVEGDVTLADINERILMRPTKPVRHPVGEFACGPCVSAHGPGLSGKAVVGLTRIHTQGRGTITIIRTRG